MNKSITVTHRETESKGRYEARVDGKSGIGELTYSRPSAGRIIVDHTEVDKSLRGLGLGQALVERVVADAREKDFRIVPLCPFVKALARRHPEWSDVMES